jgi:thiol-disulfide isomerase/thioredoxin
LNLNNYYANINKGNIEYAESLKNTDYLAEIHNPDELFQKLIEPYKGKVIYLDFWGTWCSPCRENMKLAGAIEKELHGKDVVFMYFANNSPKQTWENVIKEMKLTGENIVHYCLENNQESLLENKLSIYSFPTYMIIDKAGNLVNTNAPSPREKDKLIVELNRILTE